MKRDCQGNRCCTVHDMITAVGFSCEPGTSPHVMKTMGHRDVKAAMHHQHPELEIARTALDYGTAAHTAETVSQKQLRLILRHTPKSQ